MFVINYEFIPSLSSETATSILSKVLEQLQEPINVRKLEEARDNVGNEMLKMMQHIFPIVMQVEMDVTKDFGFPDGRESIVKFAQMIRSLEQEDTEIARLHSLIKAYYLPPVSVNATNESSAEDRISSS
ncbi:hypothetical protein RN001_014286 [Aquatica leii]|uniref:Protein C10 n=1 Tax=Aquatica leii TaxID=1421715 RepID=A0AAN7P5L6_9COLE|nr:hypothetical protein RN001_014286 [Aquatica leii]